MTGLAATYLMFCMRCLRFVGAATVVPYIFECPFCGLKSKPIYRRKIRLETLPKADLIFCVHPHTQAYFELAKLQECSRNFDPSSPKCMTCKFKLKCQAKTTILREAVT